MNRILHSILFFFLLSLPNLYAQVGSTAINQSVHDSTEINGIYIPKNLNECFDQLNKTLNKKDIKAIKSVRTKDILIGEYHFGLGLWMRNNWGLWNGSRLSKYFNGLGIYHPDDMSSIILVSYWEKLNQKPINLTKQISFYKNYWNKIDQSDSAKITLPPPPDSSRKNYH